MRSPLLHNNHVIFCTRFVTDMAAPMANCWHDVAAYTQGEEYGGRRFGFAPSGLYTGLCHAFLFSSVMFGIRFNNSYFSPTSRSNLVYTASYLAMRHYLPRHRQRMFDSELVGELASRRLHLLSNLVAVVFEFPTILTTMHGFLAALTSHIGDWLLTLGPTRYGCRVL